MKKADKSKEKTVNNMTAFIQNKPNFSYAIINISSFDTSKYEILTAWRVEKQTQFKPNSNPIPKRPKMNLNTYITMNYKVFPRLPGKKTNPNKPKTNPIIHNLETAHKSDIYQRNSLSHLFRRPIITDECYGHNEDITLRKQFL